MIVSKKDIHNIFNKVINHEMTREEADLWAQSVLRAYDNYTLTFNPVSDQDYISDVLSYLNGIDMQIAPNEYMHIHRGYKI